jgi:hypothetical protein
MSNLPPSPPPVPSPASPNPFDNVPAYGTAPQRNTMALLSMILGIIAIPAICLFGLGIPLGIVALILGIISLVSISKNPYKGGKGMAITGIVLGIVTVLVVPLLVLLPALGRAKELANRSSCAASMTGICKALNLYGAENADSFPLVQFAPYSAALNDASGVTIGTAPNTIASYYASAANNQAGSPTACVWMLVLKGNVGPKQFICRSDPTAPGVASQTDATGNYYNNLQHGSQSSFSFSYPWAAGGTQHGSWRTTVDSSLPIISDMAPLDGTGTPARSLGQTLPMAETNPGFPKTVNSANHTGGEGQNVTFADTHTEFVKNPYVGQGGDSIWTLGRSNTPVSGGPIENTTTSTPFDTVMVPIRNATTGGM